MTLLADDRRFALFPSHIGRDFIAALCSALRMMLRGAPEATAVAFTAPEEMEFRFARSGADADLLTLRILDRRKGAIAFESSGRAAEIILPFWRGFQKLQGASSKTEISKAWAGAWPWDEMERLTSSIEEWKREQRPRGLAGNCPEV